MSLSAPMESDFEFDRILTLRKFHALALSILYGCVHWAQSMHGGGKQG